VRLLRPRLSARSSCRGSAVTGEGSCVRCRRLLPVSSFPPCPTMWRGLRSWCRSCSAENSRPWRVRNAGTVERRNAERRATGVCSTNAETIGPGERERLCGVGVDDALRDVSALRGWVDAVDHAAGTGYQRDLLAGCRLLERYEFLTLAGVVEDHPEETGLPHGLVIGGETGRDKPEPSVANERDAESIMARSPRSPTSTTQEGRCVSAVGRSGPPHMSPTVPS